MILTHNEDDELLRTYICAAIDYAKSYQKAESYDVLPPSTEIGIVMLSIHFYESRDGITGGFFADNVNAAKAVWESVNRLLALNRNIEV